MAKKVIARLKNTKGNNLAKVIRTIKSPKTGAYIFKEEIVMQEDVKKILAKKE